MGFLFRVKKMDRVNNSHLYNFNGMSLNILHIPFCNYYATVYIVRGENLLTYNKKIFAFDIIQRKCKTKLN